MASLLDFITVDEWKILTDTPILVGMAIVQAAPSGIVGSLKELLTMGTELKREAERYPDNPLLQRVMELQDQRRWNIAEGKEFLTVALERCRQSNDILKRKASAQQATEYRQMILHASERTARAAKEGGFLGFGGERFSTQEESALAQVAEALGVSGWSPVGSDGSEGS